MAKKNAPVEAQKLPAGYVPALKKVYKEEIVEKLTKQFSYTTPMQVPRLLKITINEGVGDATQDKKIVEEAAEELSVITGQKVSAILTTAGGEFKGITVTDRESGAEKELSADGMFVAIGLIPENDPFKNVADLNSYGYFDSNEACTTRTPGIFVAGDCRSKQIRQVTTACADGAVAALAACRYINELQ